jgi:hypothetical protein
MRNLMVIGLVLIGLGIAGLAFNQFSYTKTEPVMDVGPVHVEAEKEHTVSIPMIGSIVVLLAGAGLVLASRRKS